jgi:hypothetical protein
LAAIWVPDGEASGRQGEADGVSLELPVGLTEACVARRVRANLARPGAHEIAYFQQPPIPCL